MDRGLPKVSVIIVSWNARPLLERFLPGVVATDYPDLEIILADNASEDDSVAWVQSNCPDVQIVRHDANYAFCGGNNLAFPYASGKYVVFLNNDIEVERDWLTPLIACLEEDDSIAAAQPKILSQKKKNTFEYAGAAGGFMDQYGYPFARGRVFSTVEKDTGQYDTQSDVFWATGAAIALRRSALESVGLFDESFVMHMEEIDLCWRLHRAGYRVVCHPTSRVYHVGAASLTESSPRKAYLNFRNNLLTLYKNLSPRAWRRCFAARVCFDLLATVRALAIGRPREALASVRAYRDALAMRHRYSDVRPDNDSLPLFYRRSIVFDYYLRGRRRFSDLAADRLPLFRTPEKAGSRLT
ncbi:MAG: glycosyltransferase family 2 protein [Rhodothermales bacterium]|nr:glycosyltransferase family 2 protein [Rhodothermales bacterium]